MRERHKIIKDEEMELDYGICGGIQMTISLREIDESNWKDCTI
jgi:hypothetical protein